MTRNRFEDIVSTLHFNDNEKVAAEGQNGHDKLHKIQLLVDHYKKMFSNSVIPATYQANNEMMVQFKGYHGLKMYKPKKLVKWWYKIWSCAGISGYVYGFEVLGGKDAKGPPGNVQLHMLFGENNDSESENIISAKKVQSLKASKVPASVHFDNIGHWPVKSTTNWCKMDGCSSRTKFFCAKCQVYLCVAKGGETCFLDFHGIDS